jgi:hypothetical protein
MQCVHAVLWFLPEYVPGVHGRKTVTPSTGLKVPAGHAVQDVAAAAVALV